MNRMLESIFQRVMLAAILTLSLPVLVSAQQPDKVVDWQPIRAISEAKVLELVEVKVGGQPVTLGQPFAASDDWLVTLTFRVRNISGKTINRFGFGVAFPDLNANGHTPMFSVTYGGSSPQRGSSERGPLLPDEEVELRLPADQLEIMRRISVKTSGTPNLSKVNILPGLVTFEDGTGIGGISLRRQVPEKP